MKQTARDNNQQEHHQQQAKAVMPPTQLPPNDTIINIKTMFAENTDEFCTHSTLHGLKYVVDEHLYPMERIFFALSFVAVVILAAFFISNVYAKWRSTPVILGINPMPSFIVNEPFPAVTICNLNQASRSKVTLYKENSSEHAMLQLLCKREINLTIADTIDWSSIEDFIVNISQPCEDMLISCRYGAIDYNCRDIFRTIVTDEGLCCVFNMVHPKFMFTEEAMQSRRNSSYTDDAVPVDWHPERGYGAELPPHFYPRTVAGTGETLGLSLTLDASVADYYCSSSNSIGFKIALHSPNETPHVREIGTLLAAGMESKVRIRFEKTEAALQLKSMDRTHRQCLFESEAQLAYFAYYSRRNCEMECMAHVQLEHCGCLAHYMPKIEKLARTCGVRDTACAEQVRQNKVNRTQSVQCQESCWPGCFDLAFQMDLFAAGISHAGFNIANEQVKSMHNEYAERNVAVVHFYFEDNTFRSTRQTEFIGITDFLSSVGGLMGLFMGFSFISIAEFFYYAILRPYHMLKRHERLVKVGNQNASNSYPMSTMPIEVVAMTAVQTMPRQTRRLSDHFGHFVKPAPIPR